MTTIVIIIAAFVGQVDLPEGVRIQTLIDGGAGDFEIGMRMRLEADVVSVGDDGTEYCGFKFVPAGFPAGETCL